MLAGYFRRIGYAGTPAANLETLCALHRAHVGRIPFENIDVLLGRPGALDPDSLFDKLVVRRRGGYCFEQNNLFQDMLRALGYTVRGLAARVRFGSTRIGARGHMLLMVDVAGQPWIADVGFGGIGLLDPIPLVADRVFSFPLVSFKLTREGDVWVLHAQQLGEWITLYAFSLEPQERIDYEVQHYHTSTHPSSHFISTLTAQLVTPDQRLTLRKSDLAILTSEGTEHRRIASSSHALTVLRDSFGLELPPGTEFPAYLFA
jgi:N-hydroxyarylamine O-acetyltransferase